METIDITPTWVNIAEWYIRVLEDPNVKNESKEPIKKELRRMAELADKYVETKK